jgi:hypothetical protein
MITHPVRAGACALSASLRSRLMARRSGTWPGASVLPALFHSGAA